MKTVTINGKSISAEDLKLTIKHLKQIRRAAIQMPLGGGELDMAAWARDTFGKVPVLSEVLKGECPTSMCLVGLAAHVGIGDTAQETWHPYYATLVPALVTLDTTNPARSDVFGSHLRNDLLTRIRGIQIAIDMLKEHTWDSSKLPD